MDEDKLRTLEKRLQEWEARKVAPLLAGALFPDIRLLITIVRDLRARLGQPCGDYKICPACLVYPDERHSRICPVGSGCRIGRIPGV